MSLLAQLAALVVAGLGGFALGYLWAREPGSLASWRETGEEQGRGRVGRGGPTGRSGSA